MYVIVIFLGISYSYYSKHLFVHFLCVFYVFLSITCFQNDQKSTALTHVIQNGLCVSSEDVRLEKCFQIVKTTGIKREPVDNCAKVCFEDPRCRYLQAVDIYNGVISYVINKFVYLNDMFEERKIWR